MSLFSPFSLPIVSHTQKNHPNPRSEKNQKRLTSLGERIEFIKNHNLKSVYWDDQKKEFCDKPRSMTSKVQAETFTAFMKSITGEALEEKELITELFFTILPKKDKAHKFFQRSEIPDEVWDVLEKSISPKDGNNAGRMISTALTTAQVWAKMGNVIQSKDGSSISYQVYKGDNKEDKLGIFKPNRMEPLGKENKKLGQRIKKLVLKLAPIKMVGSLWETAAGQGFVGEKVASLISDQMIEFVGEYIKDLDDENVIKQQLQAQLGIGLVPKTEIGEFHIGGQEEIGSFQEWFQHPHQDAYKFLGYKNKNCTGKSSSPDATIPTELFELLVILDYLTGNSDRHGENWFVSQKEVGEGENSTKQVAIVPIDGGWSMAPEAPLKGAIELGNQYKWGKLPLAESPFSAFGKSMIQHFVDDQRRLQNELLGLYDAHLSGDENKQINKKRIRAMADRIAVLESFLDDKSNANKTKTDLSKIRTQDEILEVIHPKYMQEPEVIEDKRWMLARIYGQFRATIGELFFALTRGKNHLITEENILSAAIEGKRDSLPKYDTFHTKAKNVKTNEVVEVPQKQWKENSECLHVFLHGLNAHPSSWDAHLAALEKVSTKADPPHVIDTLTPFIPKKGQCSLKRAAKPIIKAIEDYHAKNPGKPIVLSGVSNGGVLALYIAKELRKNIEVPIGVTTIAAPLLGTQAQSKTGFAKNKVRKYNPEVQNRLAYGGQASQKLLDSIPKDIDVVCYGGREDFHVTPLRSALPSIEGALLRPVSGVMHHSILDSVALEHIEESVKWVGDKKRI